MPNNRNVSVAQDVLQPIYCLSIFGVPELDPRVDCLSEYAPTMVSGLSHFISQLMLAKNTSG